MTETEQRIAIAEACETLDPCPDCGGDGYTTGSEHHPSCDGSCVNCPVPVQIQCPTCGGACTLGDSPDYIHDLNAMHEAEKTLTTEQWDTYEFWINHFTVQNEAGHAWSARNLHANAAQRREAFLRTVSKWKE